MSDLFYYIGVGASVIVIGWLILLTLFLGYAKLIHNRFHWINGNPLSLSIASWPDTRPVGKDGPGPYTVDDFPLSWVRGVQYGIGSGRSLVFHVGITEKRRFGSLTGRKHPTND